MNMKRKVTIASTPSVSVRQGAIQPESIENSAIKIHMYKV